MMLRLSGRLPQLALTTNLRGSHNRNASTDAISEMYIAQIRRISDKMTASGGSLVDTSPELKKQLDDELNRLAQKHGLMSAEIVGKLSFTPESSVVESSVASLVEGKSISNLMAELEVSKKTYQQEHTIRKHEDARYEAFAQFDENTVVPEVECCMDDEDTIQGIHRITAPPS